MGFLTELRNEIRQTPQTVRDIRDFLTQDIFGPFQAGITLSEQLPRHKGLTNWDQQTNPFKGISLDPERVTFDAAGRFKSGAVTQDDQDMGFLAVDYDKNGDPQAISIATMQYADVRLVVALTKTATGFDFRCAEIDVNPIDDTYTMQEASSHITETRNHGLPLIPTSMAAFSLLTASMYEALCYLPGQETTGRNQLFDFIDSMRSSVFSSGLPSSNFYVHAPTEVSSERLSLEISSSASSTYSINLYQNTETASSVIMLTNDVKGISYEISSSGVRFFTPEGYLTLSEIDIQAVEQLESVLQAIQKRITGEIASLNLAEGVFPGNVFTFVPSGRKEALLPYQEALATAQATLKSHTLPVPSTGVMDRTRHFAFAQKIAPDVHIGILDEANIRIDAEGFGVLEREGIEIGRVYQMGNTIVFYELATNTMLLFDPQTGRSKIFLREVPSTDYKELEPVIEDVASQQVFKMHDAVLIALQLYQKLPDNQTGMKSILSAFMAKTLLDATDLLNTEVFQGTEQPLPTSTRISINHRGSLSVTFYPTVRRFLERTDAFAAYDDALSSITVRAERARDDRCLASITIRQFDGTELRFFAGHIVNKHGEVEMGIFLANEEGKPDMRIAFDGDGNVQKNAKLLQNQLAKLLILHAKTILLYRKAGIDDTSAQLQQLLYALVGMPSHFSEASIAGRPLKLPDADNSDDEASLAHWLNDIVVSEPPTKSRRRPSQRHPRVDPHDLWAQDVAGEPVAA